MNQLAKRTYTLHQCRWGELGFDGLMEPERRFVGIFWLSDIYNGGFGQYFQNSSGDLARFALNGLREIGANRTADLLEEAMGLIPGGYTADQDIRKGIIRSIPAGEKRFDSVELRFYDNEETYEDMYLGFLKSLYLDANISQHTQIYQGATTPATLVQAELKNIQSNDHRCWEDFLAAPPPEPWDSSGWFSVEVGPDDGCDAGETFQVLVVTPVALSDFKPMRGDLRFVIVESFEPEAITGALRQHIAASTASSWEEIRETLRKSMWWDRESILHHYQALTSNRHGISHKTKPPNNDRR